MERIVTATEANREFSRILGEVADGHTYIVTSRGKRVARIEPDASREATAERERRAKAWNQLLARLRTQPVLDLPRFGRDDFYE
jgi:prevent-host-death family protein